MCMQGLGGSFRPDCMKRIRSSLRRDQLKSICNIASKQSICSCSLTPDDFLARVNHLPRASTASYSLVTASTYRYD